MTKIKLIITKCEGHVDTGKSAIVFLRHVPRIGEKITLGNYAYTVHSVEYQANPGVLEGGYISPPECDVQVYIRATE